METRRYCVTLSYGIQQWHTENSCGLQSECCTSIIVSKVQSRCFQINVILTNEKDKKLKINVLQLKI
jgi:hypothetical protein